MTKRSRLSFALDQFMEEGNPSRLKEVLRKFNLW